MLRRSLGWGTRCDGGGHHHRRIDVRQPSEVSRHVSKHTGISPWGCRRSYDAPARWSAPISPRASDYGGIYAWTGDNALRAVAFLGAGDVWREHRDRRAWSVFGAIRRVFVQLARGMRAVAVVRFFAYASIASECVRQWSTDIAHRGRGRPIDAILARFDSRSAGPPVAAGSCSRGRGLYSRSAADSTTDGGWTCDLCGRETRRRWKTIPSALIVGT